VEAVVEIAREVEDVLEGVDVPVLSVREAARRRSAGFSLGFLVFDEVSCSEVSEDSSPSSSSEAPLFPFSSIPLGYSAHEVVTWYRVIGVRFSSSAAKASKQYRQCSTVAILTVGAVEDQAPSIWYLTLSVKLSLPRESRGDTKVLRREMAKKAVRRSASLPSRLRPSWRLLIVVLCSCTNLFKASSRFMQGVKLAVYGT